MKWNMREVRSGNPLTDVHANDFSKVAELYDGQNPANLATYQNRAKAVLPQFTAQHREQLVTTLSAYMKRLGSSEQSFAQLERLLDPTSVAVVTGQQAGLFGGPLFSIYKALTAVGLAQRLERDLGHPVVPVFWIASEDHDWGEVNHAFVLDEFSDVRKLQIEARAQPHEMVYHTQLTTESVDAVLQRAQATIPDGIGKMEMLEFLRRAWEPGESLADWFGRVMAHLMNRHGLILLDPCLEGLRGLVGSVWERALLKRYEVQSHLSDVYQQLQAVGYSPTVLRDETNATLFYVEDGRRYVLEISGESTLRVRGLGIEKSVQDWVELARTQPTSFSSNVLLRPVVQDVLLPTLAYVGGPAEVAYFPLSRGVFHAHERVLPPVLLRQRVRLFTPTVLRNLKKWDLSLADVATPRDFVAEFLQEEGIETIDAHFASRVEEREREWSDWRASFAHLGPQIEPMAKASYEEERHRLHRLRRKTRRLFEQTRAAQVGQLRQIERWLWTDGHEQERRLCPLSVWAEVGSDCLRDLPAHGDYTEQAPFYEVEIQ